MTPAPTRLEHAHAFDTAASWLACSNAPLLGVVSTPEFVDLVMARATGPVVLACENDHTADYAHHLLASGALPPEVAAGSKIVSPMPSVLASETQDEYVRVLWAAPQHTTWGARLAALETLVHAEARICIFTATFLGGLIQPARRAWQEGDPAPLAQRVRARLCRGGWRISHTRELGHVTSMGWALGARLAAVARRLDLADRAERAHHSAVEANGGGATYAVILAERTAVQVATQPGPRVAGPVAGGSQIRTQAIGEAQQ